MVDLEWFYVVVLVQFVSCTSPVVKASAISEITSTRYDKERRTMSTQGEIEARAEVERLKEQVERLHAVCEAAEALDRHIADDGRARTRSLRLELRRALDALKPERGAQP